MLSRVVEVVELIWTERRNASFLSMLEASWPQATNKGFNNKGYATSAYFFLYLALFCGKCIITILLSTRLSGTPKTRT